MPLDTVDENHYPTGKPRKEQSKGRGPVDTLRKPSGSWTLGTLGSGEAYNLGQALKALGCFPVYNN